jgi:hypothetical protein
LECGAAYGSADWQGKTAGIRVGAMNDQVPQDSRNDASPGQVSGAVRLGAAIVIALIALGITALAVRWIPGPVAEWPQ